MACRQALAQEEPMADVNPAHIMQIGMGFLASKTLLSAVELGLFTELAKGPLTGAQIAAALALSPRAIPDFPDALVALGLLERAGNGPDARYSNTMDGTLFLDRASPAYIGGILEMANARLYRFWADLTPALKTGAPQNEIKATGESMFPKLYENPERLEQFMNAMSGVSAANFALFAKTFDFSRYHTLCDVGGATAQLSCQVAAANPHMNCTSFDLPMVAPIANRRIEREGLSDRVTAVGGDFFSGPLPKADVITMGMVLHDWNLPHKKMLIAKAYEALPPGGAFVVIESLIDDARRENAFGLLMSLNMLIEFGDAFDYTGADFRGWCREAGFRDFAVMKLAGPSSAAVAYK
jgi:ubiquinone/menaquinone biosynthesis C-methylase UbiE